MNEPMAQQNTEYPRLQQAYNTALLQFQAYLLEKRLTGEATISRTQLVKMISCN